MLADAVAKEIPALKKHRVCYDFAVAKNGCGDFFDVQKAVDTAPYGKKTTIQVFKGTWQKPTVPKGKKVKFVMRKGARWSKAE